MAVSRADVVALVPEAHWHHAHRCWSGQHSCWDPDDDDPDREPYEYSGCAANRLKAEKERTVLVNRLYGLVRKAEIDALEEAAQMLDRRGTAYNAAARGVRGLKGI